MILDPFAGPGGWSEGLRELGLHDIGIEIDAAACATRAAAGHLTIRADVATYPVEVFTGRVEGLVISPPCQDFSRAGKRKGLAGDSGRLVFEVMRWSKALRPLWIACEQVPDVLPIWREFAWELRKLGYSTWAGILCAADYGVPQTRERAFLLAHRGRPALPPEPTHCRGGREADLWGRRLLPWVSMAEALGWDGEVEKERGAGMEERGAGMEERYGHRRFRPTAEPAPTVSAGVKGSGPRLVYHPAVLRGNQIPDRASRDYKRRSVEQPAQVISSMAHLYRWEFVNGNQPRAAHRGPHEPAPTIAFGHNAERVEWVLRSGQSVAGGERAVWRSDEPSVTVTQNVDDCRWVVERPATTVQADPRIGRPGHKDRSSDGEPQFARESVRVSIEEAAILQGFRLDYPFQGTKTKRFEQVGNAVPPPMAAAVVGALTGIVAESLGAALP